MLTDVHKIFQQITFVQHIYWPDLNPLFLPMGQTPINLCDHFDHVMRGNCFGFRYARRLDVLFLVLFFVKSCLSVRFTFTSFSQNVTYWFWLTFTQRGFPRVSLNAKQTDSLVLTNPPRQMGQFIWLHRCSISVGMGKWNWVQKPLSPPTHPPTDPPSPQRTQCSVCVCVSADKRAGREAILACFFCLRVFFHCSSSSSTFSSSLSIPSIPPTAQTHPAPIFPPPPPPVGEFVLTSKSNCLKQNYNSRTGCARAQNKSACCT